VFQVPPRSLGSPSSPGFQALPHAPPTRPLGSPENPIAPKRNVPPKRVPGPSHARVPPEAQDPRLSHDHGGKSLRSGRQRLGDAGTGDGRQRLVGSESPGGGSMSGPVSGVGRQSLDSSGSVSGLHVYSADRPPPSPKNHSSENRLLQSPRHYNSSNMADRPLPASPKSHIPGSPKMHSHHPHTVSHSHSVPASPQFPHAIPPSTPQFFHSPDRILQTQHSYPESPQASRSNRSSVASSRRSSISSLGSPGVFASPGGTPGQTPRCGHHHPRCSSNSKQQRTLDETIKVS
jgi:hypothetical protein